MIVSHNTEMKYQRRNYLFVTEFVQVELQVRFAVKGNHADLGVLRSNLQPVDGALHKVQGFLEVGITHRPRGVHDEQDISWLLTASCEGRSTKMYGGRL